MNAVWKIASFEEGINVFIGNGDWSVLYFCRSPSIKWRCKSETEAKSMAEHANRQLGKFTYKVISPNGTVWEQSEGPPTLEEAMALLEKYRATLPGEYGSLDYSDLAQEYDKFVKRYNATKESNERQS